MDEKNHDNGSDNRIQTDPLILSGKPFLKGTRLSVEFLQGLTALGWSKEKIMDVYPYLSVADIEAALAHAA